MRYTKGMPPRRPSRPPPPPVPPPRRSSSGLAGLVGAGAIAPLLAAWASDPEDRAFIARCIASEGPSHHRVASATILRLLALAVEAAGGAASARPEHDGFPVPFRLPPHLDRHADEDAQYPLRLSRRALERLAPPGSHELAALADAVTDGPAHHALANVVMVNLLEELIERLKSRDADPSRAG